jgi:hypothetical protein
MDKQWKKVKEAVTTTSKEVPGLRERERGAGHETPGAATSRKIKEDKPHLGTAGETSIGQRRQEKTSRRPMFR